MALHEQYMCGKNCFEKTLYYNSPAHGGWGIVRITALIPDSHILFICPAACFRHGALGAVQHGYKDKASYLYVAPTDVVSGYDDLIVEGVEELLCGLQHKIRALFLFVSCLDDFIGTDMEAITRQLTEQHPDIIFQPCHMNPIASETKKPPIVTAYDGMIATMVSSMERRFCQREKKNTINLLGNFAGISKRCEVFDFFQYHGYDDVLQIADFHDFQSYCEMGKSQYNIVLTPIAQLAAKNMKSRIQIDNIQSFISYDMEGIEESYRAIEAALQMKEGFDFSRIKAETKAQIQKTIEAVGDMPILVSDSAVLRPFSLALALLRYGFHVTEIFAQDAIPSDKAAYQMILQNYPEVEIKQPQHFRASVMYQNKTTEMLGIGYEGAYLRQCKYVADLSSDEGMYGFYGVCLLMKMMRKAMQQEADLKQMIEVYGAVV